MTFVSSITFSVFQRRNKPARGIESEKSETYQWTSELFNTMSEQPPVLYNGIEELLEFFNAIVFPLKCRINSTHTLLRSVQRFPDGSLAWFADWVDETGFKAPLSLIEIMDINQGLDLEEQMKIVCNRVMIYAFTRDDARRHIELHGHQNDQVIARRWIRLSTLFGSNVRSALQHGVLGDQEVPHCGDDNLFDIQQGDLPPSNRRLPPFHEVTYTLIHQHMRTGGSSSEVSAQVRSPLNIDTLAPAAPVVASSNLPPFSSTLRRRRANAAAPAAASSNIHPFRSALLHRRANAAAAAVETTVVNDGNEDGNNEGNNEGNNDDEQNVVKRQRVSETKYCRRPAPVICCICQSEVEPTERWMCPKSSKHVACIVCFQGAIQSEISRPQPRLPLRCVHNYSDVDQVCEHEIPEYELKQTFLTDPKQLSRYEDACVATVRSQDLMRGSITDVQCPSCNMSWEIERQTNAEFGLDLIMFCPSCHVSFCTGCHKMTSSDGGTTSNNIKSLTELEQEHDDCYQAKLHITPGTHLFGEPGVPLTKRQLKNLVWRLEQRIQGAQPHCPECHRASEKDEKCNLVSCDCTTRPDYCYVCSKYLASTGDEYYSLREQDSRLAAFMIYDNGDHVREHDNNLNIMYHQWETNNIPLRHQHNPTNYRSPNRLCPHSLVAYWSVHRIPAYKNMKELQCITVFMNDCMMRAIEGMRLELNDSQHFVEMLQAFPHFQDTQIQLVYEDLIQKHSTRTKSCQTGQDLSTFQCDTCPMDVSCESSASSSDLPQTDSQSHILVATVISNVAASVSLPERPPYQATKIFQGLTLVSQLRDPFAWCSSSGVTNIVPAWRELSEDITGKLGTHLQSIKSVLQRYSEIMLMHFDESDKTRIDRVFAKFNINGYEVFQISYVGAMYLTYVVAWIWDALHNCLIPQYRPLQRDPAHKNTYDKIMALYKDLQYKSECLDDEMTKCSRWLARRKEMMTQSLSNKPASAASAAVSSSSLISIQRTILPTPTAPAAILPSLQLPRTHNLSLADSSAMGVFSAVVAVPLSPGSSSSTDAVVASTLASEVSRHRIGIAEEQHQALMTSTNATRDLQQIIDMAHTTFVKNGFASNLKRVITQGSISQGSVSWRGGSVWEYQMSHAHLARIFNEILIMHYAPEYHYLIGFTVDSMFAEAHYATKVGDPPAELLDVGRRCVLRAALLYDHVRMMRFIITSLDNRRPDELTRDQRRRFLESSADNLAHIYENWTKLGTTVPQGLITHA